MKKLILLSILLIVGCASRPKIKNINILDGEISSGSITLKTEDIIKDCKKECVTFTISSRWMVWLYESM